MGLTTDKAAVVCCVTQVKFRKFEEGTVVPMAAKINRMCIFAHIEQSAFEADVSLLEFEEQLRKQIEKEDRKYKGWLKISPSELAAKLTVIRNIHRLTQRQMALIANCTIDSYAYLEKEGCSLLIGDTSVVSCISSYFDIPLSDLFSKEVDMFASEYRERIEYQERQNKKKGIKLI